MHQVWQEIQQKLELLKQKVQKPEYLEFFGASKHKYSLNPCLRETEIQAFEQSYSIVLPDDYRDFLLYVGNGGAGPKYGLLSLEESIREVQKKKITIAEGFSINDSITEKLERREVDYSFLSKPFPLTNLDALDAIAKRINDLEKDEIYFIEADYPLCGSMPISHQGCGWKSVLVITGEQRGQMWMAGDGWLPEFCYEQPTQKDFLGWYQAWLDNSIRGISKWEQ